MVGGEAWRGPPFSRGLRGGDWPHLLGVGFTCMHRQGLSDAVSADPSVPEYPARVQAPAGAAPAAAAPRSIAPAATASPDGTAAGGVAAACRSIPEVDADRADRARCRPGQAPYRCQA